MADFVVTPSSVQLGDTNISREAVAGATITAGMAIYLDATDEGKAKPADCTVEESSKVVGIAVNSASSGQPIDYVERSSNFTCGFTAAAGDVIVASTLGSLQLVADLAVGDFTAVCGVMATTTTMNVHTTEFTRSPSVII